MALNLGLGINAAALGGAQAETASRSQPDARLGLDAHASGTRLEDLDGQARFRIDVDLGAWLVSPTFNDLLTLAREAVSDESLAMMGMMLAAALKDTSLTIESAIDNESGRMERLALALDIRLDASLVPGSGSDTESVAGSLLP